MNTKKYVFDSAEAESTAQQRELDREVEFEARLAADGRPRRFLLVETDDQRQVAAYLPRNYKVISSYGNNTIVAGYDNCGWTLDDYVIPRLGSGWIHGEEITSDEAEAWSE